MQIDDLGRKLCVGDPIAFQDLIKPALELAVLGAVQLFLFAQLLEQSLHLLL